MDLKIYRINEKGVDMIRQFLLDCHKRPEDETTDSGMARWLMDAQVCADITEGVIILEIPAEDSASGQAVSYRLDESGVDVGIFRDV